MNLLRLKPQSAKRWFANLGQGVSLRQVLIVPFLLQISLVGFVAWLPIRNKREDVNNVARKRLCCMIKHSNVKIKHSNLYLNSRLPTPHSPIPSPYPPG